MRFLKQESFPRFRRLNDLTAIDESARRQRDAYPDYTLVYQLLSFDPAGRLRLKVPLTGKDPTPLSVTDLWPSADWYEREAFDMFGIRFEVTRTLNASFCPMTGKDIPCAKVIPAGPPKCLLYTLADARRRQPLDAGFFVKTAGGEHPLVLNVGPHHVSTHG